MGAGGWPTASPRAAGALALVWAMLLIACAAPAAPTATPEDPLAATRRWGRATTSYRFERTTLTPHPDGGAAVLRESGEVVLPDRQRLAVTARARGAEERHEVIVIGERAWMRPVALGGDWREAPAGARPADPLTLALATLAVAGPPRSLGERREADGRLCGGWAYAFDPARVAAWPARPAGRTLTAEASLWREPGGALCAQTVRLQRDGLADGEFTVTFRDAGAPLSIDRPDA